MSMQSLQSGVAAAAILAAAVAGACDSCHEHTHSTPTESHPKTPEGGTAPPVDGAWRFGVIADTQGLQFVERLVTDLNAHEPELVVFPGDLVSTGSPNSWGRWKDLTDHFVAGPERRLMVPGNHDLPVGGDAAWQQAFGWLPDSQVVGRIKGIDKMDYYYDFGDTRFISVTTDSQSNGAGGQPAALQWLRNVLRLPDTQSKEHVFVYSHHPITFNNYDRTGGTDGAWWRAMADSGLVDAVFVGHWHQYQPSQPDPHSHTWEVISGTGNAGFSGHAWQNHVGYSVVEVNGPEAVLRFYGDADSDGAYDDLLDDFVIATEGGRARGVVGYYGFQNFQENVDAAPLGSGNTGAYVGDARVTPNGFLGNALALDGDRDHAHGGGISDYDLALLGDLTLSIRANYAGLDDDPDGNTLVSYTADVAGYTDREESVNQPYNLRLLDDGRVQFFWERGNNEKRIFVSTEAAPVQPGVWREYRVTRDAMVGEVAFYVDGQMLGDPLEFDPFTDLPTGGGQGTLRIGANYNRDRPQKLVGGFDGLLDELVIWNEPTTAVFDPPPLPCSLPGDINNDCQLDAFDWRTLRDNQRVDMTGLSAEEARLLGDLNGDFRNDFEDFVLFKLSYTDLHGEAAFARLISAPEPAALSLAGLLLITLFGRREGHARLQ